MTVEALQAFADAWNRHDVDALMTFMTDDCVFASTAGPDINGALYTGSEQVRAAFADVFRGLPDAHFGDAQHFVSGNRGLSEWALTGTTSSGSRFEARGCDVFTFRDGKNAVKNTFMKNRTAE